MSRSPNAPVPLRILRAYVEKTVGPARLSDTVRARQERFLDEATVRLVQPDGDSIRFKALATALGTTPATLTMYFCDIHGLRGAILKRHLDRIEAALATVPPGEWNVARQDALYTAYQAATRLPGGALRDAHRVLLEQRRGLPPDVLYPLAAQLGTIAETLGPDGAVAMALLDRPGASGRDIIHTLRMHMPETPNPHWN